jgi:hypothetical protein
MPGGRRRAVPNREGSREMGIDSNASIHLDGQFQIEVVAHKPRRSPTAKFKSCKSQPWRPCKRHCRYVNA